jgi:hypothetical protein
MNEIQIRPHTQTTAVSIQTTVSHFGSGSLLRPISCRFGIWCPSPRRERSILLRRKLIRQQHEPGDTRSQGL